MMNVNGYFSTLSQEGQVLWQIMLPLALANCSFALSFLCAKKALRPLKVKVNALKK